VTVLIRRPRYLHPEDETDAVEFMRMRIEPYMKAINDELRRAGLVGPGGELAVHITSQSESMRTVLEWREEK
jgi:hypothetical protein